MRALSRSLLLPLETGQRSAKTGAHDYRDNLVLSKVTTAHHSVSRLTAVIQIYGSRKAGENR
jgi:hypothetical protein